MSFLKADYEIRDPSLAAQGEEMLNTARQKMPVLELISMRFQKTAIFKGMKILLCLHATRETAILAMALKAGGADVYMVGCNVNTINDPVMATLAVNHGVHVFADSTKNSEENRAYMDRMLCIQPDIFADDGAVMVERAFRKKSDALKRLIGSTEQTTAGIRVIREFEQNQALPFPVINVNDSNSKYLFDNQFGVGQSFVSTCNKFNPFLFSEKNIVICGFGWCGKGAARVAAGMGANIIVTEVNPFKAMEAHMLGYRVMPIREAAKYGDVFATFTGSTKVIDYETMCEMKREVVVMNCGSGTTEIDVETLKEKALFTREENKYLTTYVLPNGNHIRLVCDGNVANIVCVGGNASEIMDLSFSIQAMAIEYLVESKGKIPNKLQCVPDEVDQSISRLKLRTYGITIDSMTQEQKKYAARFIHLTK